MEDKRKPFNTNNFISNEKTPVETKNGHKVFIHTTNRINDKSSFYQVVGEVVYEDNSWGLYWWSKEGKFEPTEDSNRDLVFSVKKTTRRMTNYELSYWLKEKSGEHREWKREHTINVCSFYVYKEEDQDNECDKDIFIRSDKGEWRKPLIVFEE